MNRWCKIVAAQFILLLLAKYSKNQDPLCCDQTQIGSYFNGDLSNLVPEVIGSGNYVPPTQPEVQPLPQVVGSSVTIPPSVNSWIQGQGLTPVVAPLTAPGAPSVVAPLTAPGAPSGNKVPSVPGLNPNLPDYLQTAYPFGGLGGVDPSNFPEYGGPVQGGFGFGNGFQLPFLGLTKGTNIVPTQGFQSGKGFNLAGFGVQSSSGANWGGLPYVSSLNQMLGLPPSNVALASAGRRKRNVLSGWTMINQNFV